MYGLCTEGKLSALKTDLTFGKNQPVNWFYPSGRIETPSTNLIFLHFLDIFLENPGTPRTIYVSKIRFDISLLNEHQVIKIYYLFIRVLSQLDQNPKEKPQIGWFSLNLLRIINEQDLNSNKKKRSGALNFSDFTFIFILYIYQFFKI